MNCSFNGKTMENVRSSLKIELIKKDEVDKGVKMQSRLTFNCINKSQDISYSYTYKHNEILMDKSTYLGLIVLELTNLLLYETYCDKVKLYFGKVNIHLYCSDTEALVLSLNTNDITNE